MDSKQIEKIWQIAKDRGASRLIDRKNEVHIIFHTRGQVAAMAVAMLEHELMMWADGCTLKIRKA